MPSARRPVSPSFYDLPDGTIEVSTDDNSQIIGAGSGVPLKTSTQAKTSALAAAMASPPTVVENGTAFVLTTTTTAKTPIDPAFIPSGGPLYDGGNGLAVSASGREPSRSDATPETQWTGSMRWAFDFDGTSFEFWVLQFGGTSFRVWVDGLPVAVAATAFANVNGYVKVTFAGRAYRRIVIELLGAVYFRGTRNTLDGQITRPQMGSSKALWIGDSYGAGVGASDFGRGFVQNAMRLLGFRDIYNQTSVSGTGLLAVTAPGPKFRDRVVDDVVPINPDLIVIQCSVNDVLQSKTPAACAAELSLLIASLRSLLPNARLVIVGLLFAGQATGPMIAMNTACAAQAATDGVPYVDAIGEAWFSGTGNTGATNGTGNSDFFLGADALHPPQAGHDYLAYRVAGAIARLVAGLTL